MQLIGIVTVVGLLASGVTTVRLPARPTRNFPEPWSDPSPQATPAAQPLPQAAPSNPPQAAPSPPVRAAVQVAGKRLAVLEFQGKGLDDDVSMILSDSVRAGALDGLATSGMSVMTRENMLLLIKEMGKAECTEGDCEVETARNIGADYVVSGRVVKMERTLITVLKVHETKGASLLATESVQAKSQVELMSALREQARKMIAKAFGTAR